MRFSFCSTVRDGHKLLVRHQSMTEHRIQNVSIPAGPRKIEAVLDFPERVKGVVLIIHATSSSRTISRNLFVASFIRKKGFVTVLADLLTAEEDEVYENRFNEKILLKRVQAVIDWVEKVPELEGKPLGLFGVRTAVPAVFAAAAKMGKRIGAVVARDGWPDLAESALRKIVSPVLLVVGELDVDVLSMTEEILPELKMEHALAVIPKAGYLFEEPSALNELGNSAADWFETHLLKQART